MKLPKLSSVAKKQLMAISGFVLTGFVLVHMLGNLQIFEGADAINAYADFLESLPWEILGTFRVIMCIAAIVHISMGIMLTLENWRARPHSYHVKQNLESTLASRTMIWTGLILGAFAAFHLLHFTFLCIFPEYNSAAFNTQLHNKEIYNVYKMIITGFSNPWIAAVYISTMAVLCIHLSHGASSLLQTIGFRNEKWRAIIDRLSFAYGLIIFLGFISTPTAVLISKYTSFHIFQISEIL